MRGRTIVAPDGRRWAVRRRWAPRLGSETLLGRVRRRFRQFFERIDAPDPGCGVDIGEGIVAAILIVLAVLAVVYIALPLALIVVDLAIVLLLAVAGVVGRVAFRRPWIVEAAADDGTFLHWPVVGWGASSERIEIVADSLAAGLTPPPLPS